MNRWFSVLFMSYEFEQVIYQKIKEYCEKIGRASCRERV